MNEYKGDDSETFTIPRGLLEFCKDICFSYCSLPRLHHARQCETPASICMHNSSYNIHEPQKYLLIQTWRVILADLCWPFDILVQSFFTN